MSKHGMESVEDSKGLEQEEQDDVAQKKVSTL